jgi:DNA-binding CsgD family transcriptional regulator/tetratricopeptide (TPR) repeat protein
VNAFADAHRQLERAMALEDRLPADARPDDLERIETRRRAAIVADLGGAYDRAVALTEEALELARRSPDPLVIGPLHSRLGFLKWAGGDGDGALVEHRRAVDIVPEEPPTLERAAVLAGLGGALMGLGRWSESRPICEAAIACATSCGAVSEESRARTMLGSDLVSLGELAAGLDELREGNRLAGPEPTELSVVTGHNLALNLLATDHLEEALDVATATRASAAAGGLERRYGMELAALVGDILMRLGRWDDADRATAEGLALDQRGLGTAYLAVARSRLSARRGDLEDADRRLGLVERDRLEPDLAVFHAIVSAETRLLEGRPDDALVDVDGALDAFVGSGDVLWGVPLIALGLRAAAERAESLRAARDTTGLAALEPRTVRLRGLVEELGDRIGTRSGKAWLATARAEAARLDQVPDTDAWRSAIAAWEEAGDPAETAYARFRFAESELRRAGVKADVREELLAGWRTALRLRAAWLRSAIEVLARRARIPLSTELDLVPEPASAGDGDGASAALDGSRTPSGIGAASGRSATRQATPAHSLSSREVEVLRLVAAGRSNGEIGEELFISRKTAGVHVTHILNKLGVSNRVEAAMAAARLGILDGDGGGEADDRAG